MQLTPNYNLKKPDGTDNFDKANDNQNMDAIDTALHGHDVKFDPVTGHKHTGAAGDAPKLTSSAFAPGALDDAAFGNRMVDDTATPNTGPNPPTLLFSFMGKMFRNITGKGSWIDAPAINLEAVYASINTNPAPTPLDFTYGIQALTMPRTAQWHMKGLTGRTLVNLLGRTGRTGTNANAANLDAAKTYVVINEDGTNVTVDGASQAVPYKFTGKVTAALVWATGKVAVYELPAADVTLTNPQLVAKYTYVDDMKPLTNPWAIAYGENSYAPFTEWTLHANASVTGPYKLTHVSAAAAAQDNTFIYPAVGGQAYTFSRTGADAKVILQELDAAGNILVNVNGGSPVASGFTWVTNVNTKQIKTIYRVDAVGTFVLDSPMLNLGITAKPFKMRHDQMIVLPTQLASNVAGTVAVADQLYRRGSEYWVDRHFKAMDLDGSLAWAFDADFTGFKRVTLVVPSPIPSSQLVIKYDGKIISQGATTTSADVSELNTSNVYISIADVDSGWGEVYNPSAAETQLYFNRWKMYDTACTDTSTYTSGTKNWAYKRASDGAWINPNTAGTIPTGNPPSDAMYQTPYKLQYQLATPVQEQIIPEGEITLSEGLNQVETGVGMIVRERVNSYDTAFVAINFESGPSKLKYRVARYFGIYRNEVRDTDFTIDTYQQPNNQRAWRNNKQGDQSAAYTVTYLALDLYSLSCSFQTIQGEYDSNLKTGVDRMAKNQSEIASRVSVLETQKAGKVQPQYIAPTLMNAWVAYAPIGYRKTSPTKVEFKGVLLVSTGTVVAAGITLFMLPPEYRPKQTIQLSCVTYGSDTDKSVCGIIVYTDGRVNLLLTPKNSVLLDGLSFSLD